MDKWKEKTLGEVTSYIAKGIPPKYVESETENTIRVLNQKCNRDFRISYADSRLHDSSLKAVPQEKMLISGDVLINSTGTGTAGRVAQIWDVSVPTTIDGHMILMRPTEEIDVLYYGYAVKAHQKAIESYAEGSTGQTEINKVRLQNEIIVQFPVDKNVQQKIGKLLANLDAKIIENERINKNLEQQAQAIFKEKFPHILTGMCNDTISSIVTFSNGKKRPVSDGNVPVFGGNGVLSYTGEANANNCVIVGRVGAYCGNTYLCLGNCWISDNAIQAKSRTGESQLFVYYLLKNADLPSRHIGSGQPLMTQSILNAIPIVHPSEEGVKQFIEYCTPIHNAIDNNYIENQKLAELRDALLPKLMSGELDVSDIDI